MLLNISRYNEKIVSLLAVGSFSIPKIFDFKNSFRFFINSEVSLILEKFNFFAFSILLNARTKKIPEPQEGSNTFPNLFLSITESSTRFARPCGV